jgi:hypothetical protein
MALPEPSLENFSALAPEWIVLARLFGAKGLSMASNGLRQELSVLLAPDELDAAFHGLTERGDISGGDSVKITRQGAYAAKGMLGSEDVETWPQTLSRRLPLLTLGLRPSNPETVRKFGQAEHLKPAIIAVAYGLPARAMTNTKVLCSELVWRLLRNGLPRIIGNGPFPDIDSFGPVERTLLAGLAGVRSETQFEIVTALAAKVLALRNPSVAEMRDRLIRIGVERSVAGHRARR